MANTLIHQNLVMKWKNLTRKRCEFFFFFKKINFLPNSTILLTQSTEIVNKRKTPKVCMCECAYHSEFGPTITLSIGLHHVFFSFNICSSAFKCVKEAQLSHNKITHIQIHANIIIAIIIIITLNKLDDLRENIYNLAYTLFINQKKCAKRREKWQKKEMPN